MKQNKLISIILPVFNGEKYLAASIESCLKQSYSNIELIIVNDCSTDGTQQIAKKYALVDNRIKIIKNKENKKLPASLNIGHRESKGDFITWTSDDNIYELNALEILLEELIKNAADIVYSDIIQIDEFGKKIKDVSFISIENILFGNYVGSCFLYKHEVFVRNSGYDESMFLVEDYDFWLRAIFHSKFHQIKIKLYKYRLHLDSLTSNIQMNKHKSNLFEANISDMYINFSKTLLTQNHNIFSDFQTKIYFHKKVDFNWIVKNNSIIKGFINDIIKNQNFKNKILIEKVFLNRIVQIMILDKKYLSKSLFIVFNYFKVLDLNTIKTLIKYSFFKN